MWTKKQAIEYAESQVGKTDGSLYFKIAFGYRSSLDWCAAFDSAIVVLGKLDCPYFPNTFAFDKRDLNVIGDRWVNPKDLQPGDFISFDWDGGGEYGGDHVGIVIRRYGAGDYLTVEGNVSKQVGRRHRTIENTKTYRPDGSLKGIGIIGGIRPKYEEEPKEEDVYNFKTVRLGSSGNEVMLLQSALNIRQGSGFALDGEFGPYTQSEVRRWQKAKGLYADGVCGPKTWPTVLGK